MTCLLLLDLLSCEIVIDGCDLNIQKVDVDTKNCEVHEVLACGVCSLKITL